MKKMRDGPAKVNPDSDSESLTRALYSNRRLEIGAAEGLKSFEATETVRYKVDGLAWHAVTKLTM